MTQGGKNRDPIELERAGPHDRCCNKFSLLGSSPTTVLDRMVEAPETLNSCKRSANRVIMPQEQQL